MAIAKVQGPLFVSENDNSVTKAWGVAPTEGNLLIALGKSLAGVIAGASISGWTLAISATTGAVATAGIWYKVAGAAEGDVTLAWTGSTQTQLLISEWSGLTSATLDKTAYTDTTGSAVTSRSSGTTAVTTADVELCIAAIGVGNDTTSQSFSNSYTDEYSPDTGVYVYMASKIISSAAAQETTCSWTTSRVAGGCIATFKAGGVAALSVTGVSDTATLTEEVAALIATSSVAPTDSVTITDTPVLMGGGNISTTQDVTLTEAVVIAVGEPSPNVTQDVTLTEETAASVSEPSPNVTQDIAVTDTPVLMSGGNISVTEDIALTEAVVTEPQTTLVLTEETTLTEAVAVDIVTAINVTEEITLTEAVTLEASTSQVDVTEEITLTEAVTLEVSTPDVSIAQDITITESVVLEAPAPQVSASEGITLTEDVRLEGEEEGLNVETSDTVTITINDFVGGGSDDPNVSDSITLAEAQEIQGGGNFAVSDDITLTVESTVEAVSIDVGADLELYEESFIVESVTVAISEFAINVQEEIALTEDHLESITTSAVITTDSIAVTESTVISGVGAIELSASDNVTISESRSLSPSVISVSASEDITLTEATTAAVSTSQINVTQAISVAERWRVQFAIRFISTQATDITVATASPVVTAPAGIVNGDLILIFLTTNTLANVAATSGGFTRVGTEVDGGTDCTTALLYKIASGEGASWTLTSLFDATEIGRFQVIVYRNVDQASPINTSNQTATAAAAISGPSITPTVNAAMIVQFAGTDPATGTYSATPDASPAATERADGKDASSNAYVAIQEWQQVTAAAIALDMTVTADTYGHHQIAIAPYRVNLWIHAYDGIAPTDSAETFVVSTACLVNVSDTVTVTVNNFAGGGTDSASTSDAVALTEAKTTSTETPKAAASESITLTEETTASITVEELYIADISETVTLTEEVTITEIAISLSASDTVTVTINNFAGGGTDSASASDAATLTEDTTLTSATSLVSVSDSIALTEAVTAEFGAGNQINVSETITVTINNFVGGGTSDLVATEDITVTDTVTSLAVVEVGQIYISAVSDAVVVSEYVEASIFPHELEVTAVSDSITLTEEVTAEAIVIDATTSDNVTITETVAAFVATSLIATSEDITVTDTPGMFGFPVLSVSDSITVTDTNVLDPVAVDASASEDVSIVEYPVMTIEGAEPTLLAIAITPDNVFATGVRIYTP